MHRVELKVLVYYFVATSLIPLMRSFMDACLENYRPIETKSNLLEAFAIARTLWFVYEALAQYRLRLACDKARFISFQRHGRLSGQLKEFIAACVHAG